MEKHGDRLTHPPPLATTIPYKLKLPVPRSGPRRTKGVEQPVRSASTCRASMPPGVAARWTEFTARNTAATASTGHRDIQSTEVPEVGIEPTRPCGHGILNPARLPIPPLWLGLAATFAVMAPRTDRNLRRQRPRGRTAHNFWQIRSLVNRQDQPIP